MARATSSQRGQPTVKQMFATLVEEVATLRRQNDDQQRQLETLRRTTTLLLERDSVSLHTEGKLQFKHLPLEIREMNWELAIPKRLLGYGGDEPTRKTGAALALSVPAVAHVCRESRCVFMAQKQLAKTSHIETPNALGRVRHEGMNYWTSFRPHSDALLIVPNSRYVEDNSKIMWAEHIVVAGCSVWEKLSRCGFQDGGENTLVNWVSLVGMRPEFSPSTDEPCSEYAPVCHLRTVDFAISDITKIDRNYPPNLVRRLFSGDRVKIVDLRDEEAVLSLERMFVEEIDRIMFDDHYYPCPTDFDEILDAFKGVAEVMFPAVEGEFRGKMFRNFFESSIFPTRSDQPRRSGFSRMHLEPPFKDGQCGNQLDLEIKWVGELNKRVVVRPVHVFVRVDGISKADW